MCVEIGATLWRPAVSVAARWNDFWIRQKTEFPGADGVHLRLKEETSIHRIEGDDPGKDAVAWGHGLLDPSSRQHSYRWKDMVSHTDPDTASLLQRAPYQFRGPFARWPRASDAALAVLLFVASVLLTTEGPNDDLVLRPLGTLSISSVILFTIANGALFWRRNYSLIVFGVVLAVSALSKDPVFAMMVALYSAGRYAANDRWNFLGVACTFVLVAATELTKSEPLMVNAGFGILLTFIVWYTGRRIRNRGDYLRLLQERAIQLERQQEAEAQRAVSEERTRIARELHDVVAHRVSMMTVQAGAAKTVAAQDPGSALQAMEAVETAGREALNELRHLLGVLRPDAESGELGPQPGIADVPRLVAQFKEAGLDVSLEMSPTQMAVPLRLDLSVYRILQEALTNVLKHAGPGAWTKVRVEKDNAQIVIDVLNEGHWTTTLPGSGHGIAGMRERAQLLGGSLDAGPTSDGKFQVAARLPLEELPT